MMKSTPHPGAGDKDFHFEVHCPVERPLLNILRRFVTNVAEDMGFAHDDVCKIEMAVDEACTNAFLHAVPPRSRRDDLHTGIELRLNMEPEGLTIQIQDFGRRDAAAPPAGARSIEEYQKPDREGYHGLGILIMKEFMDDVQFAEQPETGTLVTLRKFLREPGRPL